MAFVDRLLNDGEELLADVRPHPVVLVGPVLLLALALAAAIVIGGRFPGAPVEVAWLLAAMVVLPALWVLGRVMRWRGVHFLVTTSRLLYKRGVLGRDVLQLRLQRVAEVHCRQSILGRIGGWGTVMFEISSGDEPLVVEDARRPRSLQRLVAAQLDRQGSSFGGLQAGGFGGLQAGGFGGLQAGGFGGLQAGGPGSPARGRGPEPVRARAKAVADASEPSSRAGRRGAGAWSDTPPSGVPVARGASASRSKSTSVPAQLLELDELRRRGILTDAEFSAKKAELLGRL